MTYENIVYSINLAGYVLNIYPLKHPPLWQVYNIKLPCAQPGETGSFESPDKYDNCHAGYNDLNPEHEPVTGWFGGRSTPIDCYTCHQMANPDNTVNIRWIVL